MTRNTDGSFNAAIHRTEICGAKTRKGTPCRRYDIWRSGRCALHGGLSTGPKTPEGREQSRINGRKGGRPRKNPSP